MYYFKKQVDYYFPEAITRVTAALLVTLVVMAFSSLFVVTNSLRLKKVKI